MDYNRWKIENFLVKLSDADLDLEILGLVHNYLIFRNIANSGEQKKELVKMLIPDIKKLQLLKSYTIDYAFKKYSNINSSNISVAVLFDMIKTCYFSAEHKSILKQWDDDADKEKNRLEDPNKTEDKNKEARKECWDFVVDQVRSGKVDFSCWQWKGAISYLHKDLRYEASAQTWEDFNAKAVEMVKKENEAVISNPETPKTDRTFYKRINEILKSGKFNEPDVKGKIDLLRRKLIVNQYIKSVELNI